MPSLIEKPDGTVILSVRVTLKPEKDKSIIALIRSVAPRGMSRFVRETMRNGAPKSLETSNTDDEDDGEECNVPDFGINL
jgi:hypothetical protein